MHIEHMCRYEHDDNSDDHITYAENKKQRNTENFKTIIYKLILESHLIHVSSPF
jgi:hypothetical protein